MKCPHFLYPEECAICEATGGVGTEAVQALDFVESTDEASSETALIETTEEGNVDDSDVRPSLQRNSGSRGYKREAALKDQQSTGRKRAAVLYPLNRNGQCEWRGRTVMGGGTAPITGCTDGTQQARHHGPDKNTLNNEQGNVHRICHGCHNRWHAANDPNYVPGGRLVD